MLGIVPAAGRGTRIQPLAFSKELLPVGSRVEEGIERPRAVSEHLLDRMLRAGVDRICLVIAPDKGDILSYYGAGYGPADVVYVVQPNAGGLCDAVFRASTVVRDGESVVIGLPDTLWFPLDALSDLDEDEFSLLLFPVECPQLFDAVRLDDADRVIEIEVKAAAPASHWIWGAMQMPARVYRELHALWEARGRSDEYLGTLINAWIDGGGCARGVRRGRTYVDVGTLQGYRAALDALNGARQTARDGSGPELAAAAGSGSEAGPAEATWQPPLR